MARGLWLVKNGHQHECLPPLFEHILRAQVGDVWLCGCGVAHELIDMSPPAKDAINREYKLQWKPRGF